MLAITERVALPPLCIASTVISGIKEASCYWLFVEIVNSAEVAYLRVLSPRDTSV
jgi:hypothetical protein